MSDYLKIVKMSPREIKIDHAYQRLIKESIVEKIVSDFSPEIFGLPLIGKRNDGSHWGVDGQQRITACVRLLDNGDSRVKVIPCAVFESHGREHEADLFLRQDNRRSINALEKFKAACVAGHAESIAISDFLAANGFSVSGCSTKKPEWPILVCIARVKACYQSDQKALSSTLKLVAHCWEGEVSATKEILIWGLWEFIRHAVTSDHYAHDRFVRLCCETTPQVVVAEIPRTDNEARWTSGFDRGQVFARKCQARYNLGLSKSNGSRMDIYDDNSK